MAVWFNEYLIGKDVERRVIVWCKLLFWLKKTVSLRIADVLWLCDKTLCRIWYMSSGIITGILQSSSYGTSNKSLTGVTGAADPVKECVHPSPCYAILGVLISMDSSFNTSGSGMSHATCYYFCWFFFCLNWQFIHLSAMEVQHVKFLMIQQCLVQYRAMLVSKL